MTTGPFWDEIFHAVAFAAFVQVARECGGWPDSEATRRRAYLLYEEALAVKNGRATARDCPCTEMDDLCRLLR
jgi:hypothetical protein